MPSDTLDPGRLVSGSDGRPRFTKKHGSCGVPDMNWASGEVVGILTFLLPGFVAAAVFHSLTSHPKPDAF